MTDGDKRESSLDDLFDDLDKFFDSDERGDRPTAGGEEVVAASRTPGTAGEPAAPPAPEGTPIADDEILPPGWQDAADVDLGVDSGENPPIESWPPVSGEGSSDSAAPPPSSVEPAMGPVPEGGSSPGEKSPEPLSASRGEPSAEMSGEDWSRIRDVLGEEEQDEESFEFLPEEGTSAPPESLFGLGGADEPVVGESVSTPAAEEPSEISVDDLRKPPPAYRDLPGASAEEESSSPAPPAVPIEKDEPSAEPGWEEPGIAEVSEAADRLAREFAEVPGEAEGPGEAEDDLLVDLHPPQPRMVRVGEPEGMTGPSWEEPSSRPLTAEPVRVRPPGRNLPLAVITGVILGAVALIALAVAKWAFAVVAIAVVLLAQAELYTTMKRRGYQPATALGLVVGGLAMVAAYLKGEAAALAMIPLCLVLSFLWYMAALPKAREGSLGNLGSTMLGFIYVPFLAAYALLILALPDSGRALILSVLGLTIAYDVFAFGIGSLWGSRPLAPSISPKKTWGGLAGATLVTIILSLAILPSIDPISTWQNAVGLAFVVCVLAPLGDLSESLIKRDLGVKDMGSILPGHGGILDRIDSVLFVLPAAFYLFRLIF